MADSFIIDVQNAEVMQFLQHLTNHLSNMQPVYQDIAGQLEQNIDLRFISKIDPTGKPWEPHAPSTKRLYNKADTKLIKGKATVVSRGSLLMRTGEMRQSLNSKVISNAALIGFNSNIAVHHEYGTKKMPRRSMLFADPIAGELGQDDTLDVMEILSRYIDDALQN